MGFLPGAGRFVEFRCGFVESVWTVHFSRENAATHQTKSPDEHDEHQILRLYQNRPSALPFSLGVFTQGPQNIYHQAADGVGTESSAG